MYITDKELEEVRNFLSRENIEIGGWLATKAYQMMLEIDRIRYEDVEALRNCDFCGLPAKWPRKDNR